MYMDKCQLNSSVNEGAMMAMAALGDGGGLGLGTLCPEMETINGTLLYRYMMNVSFVDSFSQDISFDKHGDPPAWFVCIFDLLLTELSTYYCKFVKK